ncbi:MAG: hypothetical protein U0235_03150 [Polyangiaceae bacterium]
MSRLLLVVEDAFVTRGPGVVLLPKVTRDAVPGDARAFVVRLRLPTGEERAANASLDVAHSRGSLPPFAMVRLVDEPRAEGVVVGTEVWLDG